MVKEAHYTTPNWWGLSYDISADGQRFLMVKENAGATSATASIIVVQHWVEELKRIVPTK